MSDLEEISPQTGVDLYLEHRGQELSEKTIQNQRYRLNQFLEFCESEEIETMPALEYRHLHRFRMWRGKDVKPITVKATLATLRTFLEHCDLVLNCVPEGMAERVVLPEVSYEDEARDVKLNDDRADAILEYLETYHYASRDHVIIGILWHTNIRLGTLRAFDVEDFHPDEGAIDVRHRPETGTPLKNRKRAERSIAIGPWWVEVIQDYIDTNRYDVEDEHGRRPLITSQYGRLTEKAIRTAVYKRTRPCEIGGCPHDKDPATCEWNTHDGASGCPSSRSPHGIRRGSITSRLRDGTPQAIVSDRADVSGEVLEQHYDRRSERDRRELRRQHLSDT